MLKIWCECLSFYSSSSSFYKPDQYWNKSSLEALCDCLLPLSTPCFAPLIYKVQRNVKGKTEMHFKMTQHEILSSLVGNLIGGHYDVKEHIK